METRKALVIALFLSLVILLVELTGGLMFRSMALMADALHVVTDILAVLFSLFALVVSSRPPTASLTYGYHRFEVLASLVNGLSLLGIVAIIMYEAYLRFLDPEPIFVLGTVTFASVALTLNLLASTILRRTQAMSEGEDENVASTEMHLIGDALASLAVIVGAIAVFLSHEYFFDPLVAVFIGLIVLRSAIKTTMQGGAIIMERSPIKDSALLRQKLSSVKGVADVHDLHVWRICSHITVASMHACLNAGGKKDSPEVRKRLEEEMDKLGVHHVTIQLEEVCCLPVHDHQARI